MTTAPRRDCVFVDEHGDPGHRSAHFACIALSTTDSRIADIIECFADLRFYKTDVLLGAEETP